MTDAEPPVPSSGELEAVRAILARMGVTPEQLVAESAAPTAVPTFDEYIQRVCMAVPPATRRIYGTYWGRVSDAWGSRRLNEPTSLEIKQLAEQMKERTVVRRNSRGGRAAAEHLISALRCLYSHAVADGLIAERDDPAKRVPKPRRLASTRRAISEQQLTMIIDAAGVTGNDPNLDTLLLRLHIETACRRGGALALHRTDLDTDQCLLRLHEKGGTVRWQPISPTLAGCLLQHAEERGVSEPNGQLLRYRTGAPITSRRYDHLWQRLGRHIPWVAAQQISTHWLRHTTLTWVERNFGYGIARAYAGHNGRSDAGTTSTYVRADVYEVTRALSALTGEDHPLLQGVTVVASKLTSAGRTTRADRASRPLGFFSGS
ncbi:tyrosine-type recombinase/integrase [Micromonospora echinospora]|uniref:tyrosine-type recombinase/integrase n=1 Tax=Micromonospora echinospora TaxID=1877 RepID=UPI003A8A5C33